MSQAEKKSKGFTDEERAAMKERAKELKAEARANKDKAEGESAVLAAIAELQEPDRESWPSGSMRSSQPARQPSRRKPGTGCPRMLKDGKVVCFFQSAQKFNTRYATLGFSDTAKLDEGAMWPTAFALTQLTAAEEARIGALVKQAVS